CATASSTASVIVLSGTDYRFKGDTTYYVTNAVTFSGNVTFEAGAVIKYATNASLTLSGPVTSLGTAFRPVIFTAKDDNSVGDTIAGSTGNPNPGAYASPALNFNSSNPQAWVLSNFHIACAQTAITSGGLSYTLSLSHGQIIKCGTCMRVDYAGNSITLRNMLLAKFNTAFSAAYAHIDAENVTLDGNVYSPPGTGPSMFYTQNGPANTATLNLVNCIIANVTMWFGGNPGTLTGSNNGFYNCGFNQISTFGSVATMATANPFQIKGAGNYYLTNLVDGTGFRDRGDISLSSAILRDLTNRTTFPPSNAPVAVPAGTVWNLAAQRDTDALDLGYHYD